MPTRILDIEDLESAALQLPQEARARLAARLIESLDEEARIERTWAAEVRDRVRAIDSGEMDLLSEEESDAEIEDLLR